MPCRCKTLWADRRRTIVIITRRKNNKQTGNNDTTEHIKYRCVLAFTITKRMSRGCKTERTHYKSERRRHRQDK